MTLFYQEHPAIFPKITYDIKFCFRQFKTLDIFCPIRLWVRQIDVRGTLLNNRPWDRALQNVWWRLCGKHSQTVLLSYGLLFVKGKIWEVIVEEPFPELIHKIHEPAAIDDRFHPVKQIHGYGCPYLGIVQKLRAIETVRRMGQEIQFIVVIVQNPGKRSSVAPLSQSFRNGLIADIDEILLHCRYPSQVKRHSHHCSYRMSDLLFILCR